MKFIVLSLLLLLAGYSLEAEVGDSPLFKECGPVGTGVHFVHPYLENHPNAYLYYSGMAVGGMALADVNGDGLLDIYQSGAVGKNALWLNKGGLKFVGKGLPESLEGKGRWGTGVSLVDIDNDGDVDLYQCNYDAANQLFLNDGMGALIEVSDAAGLNVTDASVQASFADIDNDGDLDMFLLCNELLSATGRPREMPVIQKNGVLQVKPGLRRHYKIIIDEDNNYKVTEYGRKDYLFLNRSETGKLEFHDVSRESGIQLEGWGLSSVWWDYDGDGDLDLYVANDFDEPDRLFRNDGIKKNGIPQFTNVIEHVFPHTSWSSMGSDVADINQDGLPDLAIAEMASTTHYKSKTSMGALTPMRRRVLTQSNPRQYMRNHLLVNTGSGFFQETAMASGISSSNWSWAIKTGDLDNDGLQDIFVTNGMSRNVMNADNETLLGDLNKARIGKTMWELAKNDKPLPEVNLVFQNVDGKKFIKRPDWGLGLLGMSYSSAMGDLDNDGDLDLVVSDLGKKTKIYENKSHSGSSLRIALKGSKSNRMGIGARVVVTDNRGVSRTRWMNPWTGFLSQNDSVLHVGLGKAQPTKLEVFWPSGIYQNVPLGEEKSLIVTEKETGKRPAEKKANPRFVKAKMPDYVHMEKPYDDFKRQPLLPQKLSQLGPCLAKGDIDGDGDEDVFVGGAQGQEGQIFLSDNGNWVASKQSVFGGLAKYAEDSAAVWFDADGDKDLDLLVVTGSTEYEPDDTLYRDRLYLNTITDGKPVLSAAPDGAFPSLLDSGSTAIAADYDGDGDLDLFIGSRSIPGKYPLTPVSRLIRNDSEPGKVKFVAATPRDLKEVGMVTDAEWADLDRDGDPDLVIATDWGAVRIFANDGGEFTDVSKASGTAQKVGWWRSVHTVDVDGDGDLDVVAGNTGINTKYKKPSDKYPAILYYGDLDGSGKDRIVEAKIQKDKDRPLPVRGRY